MKHILFRILFFSGIFFGMHAYPLFSLVCGGILFSFLFRAPFEVLLLALYFEILAGIPSGVITIPLMLSLFLQKLLHSRVSEISYISGAALYAAGVIFFFIFQGVAMALEGAIGFYGFKILYFL